MTTSRRTAVLLAILFLLWSPVPAIAQLGNASVRTDTAAAAVAPATQRRNLRVFDAVWRIVRESYYDPSFNGLGWNESRTAYRPLAQGAPTEAELYRTINRMLDDLKDRHTHADSPSDVRDEARRSRVGIGFSFRQIEDRFVVTRVVGGSAAQDAGIKPGWLLLERDDAPIDPNQDYTVQPGQTVRLKFLDSQDRPKKLQVICRPYALTPEQFTRDLGNGLVLIRFGEFGPNTGKWFADRIAQNRGARGIIIDLRGNTGGLLDALEECLKSLYPTPETFGEFIQRGGRVYRLRVGGAGRNAYTGPVIVLTDADSGSASEIFASAIRESGRGKVVGRVSAGAVLASIEEDLPDGGKLQVSIRDYVTRGKRRLEGRGVEPDIPITLTLDDLRRDRDRDVERAVEILGGATQ